MPACVCAFLTPSRGHLALSLQAPVPEMRLPAAAAVSPTCTQQGQLGLRQLCLHQQQQQPASVGCCLAAAGGAAVDPAGAGWQQPTKEGRETYRQEAKRKVFRANSWQQQLIGEGRSCRAKVGGVVAKVREPEPASSGEELLGWAGALAILVHMHAVCHFAAWSLGCMLTVQLNNGTAK